MKYACQKRGERTARVARRSRACHGYARVSTAFLEAAPTADETVYDAGYAVSSFFSFTDRWQDAFCYAGVYARHVNLGFNRGAELPDPGRRLRGTGKRLRRVKIRAEEDLREVYLQDSLRAAIAVAPDDTPEHGGA